MDECGKPGVRTPHQVNGVRTRSQSGEQVQRGVSRLEGSGLDG